MNKKDISGEITKDVTKNPNFGSKNDLPQHNFPQKDYESGFRNESRMHPSFLPPVNYVYPPNQYNGFFYPPMSLVPEGRHESDNFLDSIGEPPRKIRKKEMNGNLHSPSSILSMENDQPKPEKDNLSDTSDKKETGFSDQPTFSGEGNGQVVGRNFMGYQEFDVFDPSYPYQPYPTFFYQQKDSTSNTKEMKTEKHRTQPLHYPYYVPAPMFKHDVKGNEPPKPEFGEDVKYLKPTGGFQQPVRLMHSFDHEMGYMGQPIHVLQMDNSRTKRKTKRKTKRARRSDLPLDAERSTCHQCKLKTNIPKKRCAKCANKTRSITLGVYCYRCLKNRYGEEYETVRKDLNWICPLCRGICNCASCRKQKNKKPLSKISTFNASKQGFNSVHHMIESQTDGNDEKGENKKIIGEKRKRKESAKNGEVDTDYIPEEQQTLPDNILITRLQRTKNPQSIQKIDLQNNYDNQIQENDTQNSIEQETPFTIQDPDISQSDINQSDLNSLL